MCAAVGATACLQGEFLRPPGTMYVTIRSRHAEFSARRGLTLVLLHGSIRSSHRGKTESSRDMSQHIYIQTPHGCSSMPAPRFSLGTDRWAIKRALSGRRTD